MDESTQHSAASEETGFLDLALILAENLRLVIAFPLAAGFLALGVSFGIQPMFTATTRLLPPQQQQSLAGVLSAQLGALAGPAGAIPGIKNPSDTYVAMLKSRTVADKVIQRFNLKQVYDADLMEEARKVLSSRTSIVAGRDGLIVVNVEDSIPQRAADIANGYVEELLGLTQSLAVSEASQRRLFFEHQLKTVRNNLTEAELALASAGINEGTLNTVPTTALELVANIKARLTAQEIKLAAMRGFMTEANPEFRQAQNELAALRTQLGAAQQKNADHGGRGAEYVARLRDFKYYEALFELMAKQYEVARLDESRESAVIQVIDPAVAPELKSKPRKARIAAATTLSAFLIILLWVFIRQAVRDASSKAITAEKILRLRNVLQRKSQNAV